MKRIARTIAVGGAAWLALGALLTFGALQSCDGGGCGDGAWFGVVVLVIGWWIIAIPLAVVVLPAIAYLLLDGRLPSMTRQDRLRLRGE